MYMDPIGGFAWICKYFFYFPKVHFLCVSTAVTNLETCFYDGYDFFLCLSPLVTFLQHIHKYQFLGWKLHYYFFLLYSLISVGWSFWISETIMFRKYPEVSSPAP